MFIINYPWNLIFRLIILQVIFLVTITDGFPFFFPMYIHLLCLSRTRNPIYKYRFRYVVASYTLVTLTNLFT